MSEDVKLRLIRLNTERTMASELIAGVGKFLDKAQDSACPKLKAKCDELITVGLAMISHHTDQIMNIRSGIANDKVVEAERIAERARVTRGTRR